MRFATIYFCLAQLEEEIQLTYGVEWKAIQNEPAMFLIKSSQPLDAAIIQVLKNDLVLWESKVQLVPDKGIHHPVALQFDGESLYTSEKIVRIEDLTIESTHYEVQLKTTDGEIVGKTAVVVDWTGHNAAEQSNDAIQISSDEMAFLQEKDSWAAIDEEHREQNLSHLFTAILEQSFETFDLGIREVQTKTDVQHADIIVEKMSEEHQLIVIAPEHMRPLYYIEEGSPFIQKTSDTATDWQAIQEYCTTLFNLSEEEWNKWQKVNIDGEPLDFTVARSTLKQQLLHHYDLIIDLTQHQFELYYRLSSTRYFYVTIHSEEGFYAEDLKGIREWLVKEIKSQRVLVVGETVLTKEGHPDSLYALDSNGYKYPSLAWEYAQLMK